MTTDPTAQYVATGHAILHHLHRGIAPFVSAVAEQFDLSPEQLKKYASYDSRIQTAGPVLTYADLDLANILNLAETHRTRDDQTKHQILEACQSNLSRRMPNLLGHIWVLRDFRRWLSHNNQQQSSQVRKVDILNLAATAMQWLAAIPESFPDAEIQLKHIAAIHYQLTLLPATPLSEPPDS